MLLTRRLLPTLLARPEAHILNVSSLAGLIPSPRLTAYQVSKAALIGFSESLRAEYGPRGLGVTALCPGPVRTNMFRTAETSPGRSVPELPNWVHTSPQHVARRAVRAIRGRHGTVVVATLAKLMWAIKRYVPGALDLAQQFRWRQRKVATVEPLFDRLAQSADPRAHSSTTQREPALVGDRASA
jgi:short-subunit dehydrogenase